MDGATRSHQAAGPIRETRYSTPAHGSYNAVETFEHEDFQTSSHYRQQHPDVAHAEPQPINEELQGISRLLGIDAEQYLLEHVEQYEASRKRWTDCTIEEWKKGADGL